MRIAAAAALLLAGCGQPPAEGDLGRMWSGNVLRILRSVERGAR